VTWSKIRGFTLDLLEMLEAAPSTTTSLSLETGESTQYVYRYLRNMLGYGLVRVEDYVWHVTDVGSSLLSLTQVERRQKEE
jgi:DNA-binding IclR family transcriptional regulator